jgi:hypothetical protein
MVRSDDTKRKLLQLIVKRIENIRNDLEVDRLANIKYIIRLMIVNNPETRKSINKY